MSPKVPVINTWFLADGAALGEYGTSRRWDLAGEGGSQGPFSCTVCFLICLENWRASTACSCSHDLASSWPKGLLILRNCEQYNPLLPRVPSFRPRSHIEKGNQHIFTFLSSETGFMGNKLFYLELDGRGQWNHALCGCGLVSCSLPACASSWVCLGRSDFSASHANFIHILYESL